MSDIQYQCFIQTSAKRILVFLPKLLFIGESRVNQVDWKEEKPVRLKSSVSCLVLKQECWKNWPDSPESYERYRGQSYTKSIETFHNADKKYLSRT